MAFHAVGEPTHVHAAIRPEPMIFHAVYRAKLRAFRTMDRTKFRAFRVVNRGEFVMLRTVDWGKFRALHGAGLKNMPFHGAGEWVIRAGHGGMMVAAAARRGTPFGVCITGHQCRRQAGQGGYFLFHGETPFHHQIFLINLIKTRNSIFTSVF
jgi:hypothetical protein